MFNINLMQERLKEPRVNAHLRNIVTSVVNPFHRIGFEPKMKEEES